MTDDRFTDGRQLGPQLRSFVLANLWAAFEGGDRNARWQRTLNLLGPEAQPRWRLRRLYEADAPRFEPRSLHRPGGCAHTLVRGPRCGQTCNRRATHHQRVTDPDTGRWELLGWCGADRGDAAEALRREQSLRRIPVPAPTTGGLLPCYIAASNWPQIYAAARPGWQPPVEGIAADDWPAPVDMPTFGRPALQVLSGQRDDSQRDRQEGALPRLRLVRS